MEKVITFIVPAYNVEQYLDKCLSSFICPSVMKKIEVIVINDGSTDRTESLAQRYANSHPDSFAVINQKNGGHGSVINLGSQLAKGRYFKVIDADDWVMTEYLPAFIEFLENCCADVIITPFTKLHLTQHTSEEIRPHVQTIPPHLTMTDIIKHWVAFEECMTFHSITYFTPFYLEYGHHLPEHVYYEDQIFSTIPCCYAKTLCFFDAPLYQYVIGNAEQSVSRQNQWKRIDHLEAVVRNLLEYTKENVNSLSEDGRKYLREKLENVILIYYLTACIYADNRKKGRTLYRNFTKMLTASSPEISGAVAKKRHIFLMMSYLHVNEQLYQKLLGMRTNK